MPEEGLIQRPDLLFRLQQFLGLKQGTVQPTLVPGLTAVVIVGDVREVSDERVIARPCAGYALVTPDVAGGHNEWELRNPPNSGVTLRVQEIVFETADLGMWLEATTTDLSGGSVTQFRDFRIAPSPQKPSAVFSSEQHFGAIGPVTFRQFVVPGPVEIANSGFPRTAGSPQPATGWTIYPGMALRMASYTLADPRPQSVSILWTETSSL
jgi:hypothetical protein